MGYLNNDTTAVDAILTKHGRQKLAEGQDLGISTFALSDEGVDYTLYNSAHASGSTNYGEAITSLPNIEAVPDDTAIMKYKLLTQNRSTVYNAVISLPQTSYTIKQQGMSYAIEVKPNTINGNAEKYIFTIANSQVVNVHGASGKSFGGAAQHYIAQTDIRTPMKYTADALKLTAAPTSVKRKVVVQIEGVNSGAYATVNVTIDPNILTATQKKANVKTELTD